MFYISGPGYRCILGLIPLYDKAMENSKAMVTVQWRHCKQPSCLDFTWSAHALSSVSKHMHIQALSDVRTYFSGVRTHTRMLSQWDAHTHTYTHSLTHPHTHSQWCMHMYTLLCSEVYAYIPKHIQALSMVYAHLHMLSLRGVRTCTCIQALTVVHAHICIHSVVYAHIHTCMHTNTIVHACTHTHVPII